MVKCFMILWSWLNLLGRISQLVRCVCVASAPHSGSLTGYEHTVLSISSITETKSKLPRAWWLECKTLVWTDGHGKIRSIYSVISRGRKCSQWEMVPYFCFRNTERTHFAGLFFSLLNLCLFCSFFYFSPVLHGRLYSVRLTRHVTLLPPRPNLSTLLCVPLQSTAGLWPTPLSSAEVYLSSLNIPCSQVTEGVWQSCWKIHCSAAGPGCLALEASLFHHLPTPVEYISLLNSSTSSNAHLTRLISSETFHDSKSQLPFARLWLCASPVWFVTDAFLLVGCFACVT